MCVHIYTYACINMYIKLHTYVLIYFHIHMNMHIYYIVIYIYVYSYIHIYVYIYGLNSCFYLLANLTRSNAVQYGATQCKWLQHSATHI